MYSTIKIFRFKVSAADSPTISITPPHSLDYHCHKGSGSPNGSVTPNGMAANKSSSNAMLLSPGYLQSPFQCNQSLKVRKLYCMYAVGGGRAPVIFDCLMF